MSGGSATRLVSGNVLGVGVGVPVASLVVPAFQTSPGMRDVLAPEAGRVRAFVSEFARHAEHLGYQQQRTQTAPAPSAELIHVLGHRGGSLPNRPGMPWDAGASQLSRPCRRRTLVHPFTRSAAADRVSRLAAEYIA